MKPQIFTQQANQKRNNIQRLLTSLIIILSFFCASSLHAQDVLVGLTSNGGPDGKGTAYTIKSDGKSFNVIKGFVDWGSYPVGSLVVGPDGWFYGMTPQGGTYNGGTIFKISSSGQMIILKNMDYTVDGGLPQGSLIVGKDGDLYGLMNSGSINNGGCIFKITTGGQYTILKSLGVNTDGGSPKGHLVQGKDGNFYGLNYSGGANGYGTIFKYTTSGTYSVLHSFVYATEGGNPYGSLVVGADSALYGMTYWGGSSSSGTIFRITTGGSFKVLHHLNGSTEGASPLGDLTLGKDGYFYGLTKNGGANSNGTAFRIAKDGTFKLLKALSASIEGGAPQGSFCQATDGSFYAMTTSLSGGYAGSVFKMTTSYNTSVVKKFTEATEGGYPHGSLVQGSDGQLYGMTYQGGKNLAGTLFKITTGGSITVLTHFNAASSGNAPQNNVAVGKDSSFYGVARNGGPTNNGSIFKICGGNTTTVRILNRATDGGNPEGGLVRTADGTLYGTTTQGGANGAGTLFKISTSGSFSVVHHFVSATDGSNVTGGLTIGGDGAIYGMTTSGGAKGGGVIFKYTTSGTFSVLYSLAYATEGSAPLGGLLAAQDGFLYGFTSSNMHFFKITTGGAFSLIKAIPSSAGSTQYGTLVQGSDGTMYGTMAYGGANSAGTIFKISIAGTVTVMRNLSQTTDGGTPKAGLMFGSDGALYGTTSTGGTNKAGTIFRITTSNSFSVLRHLKMATDGGTPLGGLVKSPVVTLVATAQAATTNEDVAKAITLTGSGAAALTYNIVILPRNGTITTGTTATRTYTPRANFYGVDSFAFTTSVGCLSSAQSWVKITVASVNDAPVLATIGNKTVVKGSTLTFTATATDVDAGQTKTFSLITPPTGAAINTTTGAFAWTPTATGTFSFKVRVTDNGSPVLYDEETITVTVTAPAAITTTSVTTMATSKTEDVKPVVVQAVLYPNPVVSNLTINLDKTAKDVKMTIVNMKGVTVYTKQYNGAVQQLQVSADALNSGSYIVLLQTAEGLQSLKFIKQ